MFLDGLKMILEHSVWLDNCGQFYFLLFLIWTWILEFVVVFLMIETFSLSYLDNMHADRGALNSHELHYGAFVDQLNFGDLSFS